LHALLLIKLVELHTEQLILYELDIWRQDKTCIMLSLVKVSLFKLLLSITCSTGWYQKQIIVQFELAELILLQ